MSRSTSITAALTAAAVLIVLASRGAQPASAHPLGNFTINHYDRIDVSDHGIQVFSVLDMAEIPAFRERQNIDANGDGTVDATEREAYVAAKTEQLKGGLTLRIDGHDIPLAATTQELTFPQGQGGLKLLRLTVTYAASLPDGATHGATNVSFEDRNDTEHIGWREIIVRSDGGVRVDGSSAPATDRSTELTAYPQDALSSPLDVRSATFSFSVVAGAAPDPEMRHKENAVRGNPDSSLSRFAGLIARDHLSAGVIVIALLAATAFGAIHALSPGHGKTIVAAYLVGSKGTARHALLLGLTVTLTHTSSVYALGFIALYLSSYIVPETLYPWLGVVSGALIVTMGLALLIGRMRSSGIVGEFRERLRRRGSTPVRAGSFAFDEAGALRLGAANARPLPLPSDHAAVHAQTWATVQRKHGDEHTHGHGARHSHSFGGAHSHAVPFDDGEPVTWRRLLGLGIFGGLLPCPSAIVVMFSAISLHRVGFGLVLIVFFSLGLAGVLTGIGFALVYGRHIADRLPLLRRLSSQPTGLSAFAILLFPIGSAAAVVIAGTLIGIRALGQL
jgi:nickel/cobalt transporter (NicO) family protein